MLLINWDSIFYLNFSLHYKIEWCWFSFLKLNIYLHVDFTEPSQNTGVGKKKGLKDRNSFLYFKGSNTSNEYVKTDS